MNKSKIHIFFTLSILVVSSFLLGGNWTTNYNSGVLEQSTQTLVEETSTPTAASFSTRYVGMINNTGLSQPQMLAINATGHIYITSGASGNVQVYSPTSQFLFKFGAPGSQDGNFSGPFGITINQTGHIYVVDRGNRRIEVFSSNGTYLFKWGSVGTGDGQFMDPHGIAINSTGTIFVADASNHRIQAFSPSGTFLFKFGGSGSGDGQFNVPVGITINATDYIYVSDHLNQRIQVFNPWGVFLMKWAVTTIPAAYPIGIAFNSTGHVFVTSRDNASVLVYSPDGIYLSKWGTSGTGNGQFNQPHGILINPQQHIFVAEKLNNRVQIFNNDPPRIENLITPATCVRFNNITLSYTFNDANGDLEQNTEILWYKNEVFQSVWTNFTVIPHTALNVGDEWNVTVKPYDGYENGTMVVSSPIRIVPNLAPQIGIVGNSTNTYENGTTGHNITWFATDDIVQNPQYAIQRNNTYITENQSWISGNQYIYSVDNLEVGTHRFTIIVWDGYDEQNLTTVEVIIIATTVVTPTAPQNDTQNSTQNDTTQESPRKDTIGMNNLYLIFSISTVSIGILVFIIKNARKTRILTISKSV